MKTLDVALLGAALVAIAEAGHQSPIVVVCLSVLPIVLVLAIIVALRFAREGLNSYRQLRNLHRLQTAADIETSILLRVENSNGDAIYRRKYKYLLARDNVRLRASRREAVASIIEH